MLKKAGIVVATAAAGLLAVSPLAFAGDKDDHDRRDHDGKHINKVDDSNSAEGRGLVFIADNNVAVNNCTNTVRDEKVISIIDDVAGLLNILGKAEANDSAVQFCHQEAKVDDSIEQGD